MSVTEEGYRELWKCALGNWISEDFLEERVENGLKGASVDERTPGRKRMQQSESEIMVGGVLEIEKNQMMISLNDKRDKVKYCFMK